MNNSSYECSNWLSFEATILNDLASEIISLDELDGELILTYRLSNIKRRFPILEVELRKASDSRSYKFCYNDLY